MNKYKVKFSHGYNRTFSEIILTTKNKNMKNGYIKLTEIKKMELFIVSKNTVSMNNIYFYDENAKPFLQKKKKEKRKISKFLNTKTLYFLYGKLLMITVKDRQEIPIIFQQDDLFLDANIYYNAKEITYASYELELTNYANSREFKF